ncbi:MAG: cytochrome B [Gammaproteobacteria bacterium]|nr:MAG: cytochrome B [Gammaproteobacteria bacterium]
MENPNLTNIKVWDPLVRIFHWSLAFFFFLAYIVEDDLIGVHTYAGYTVALLVSFRLIWGFIGTPYARFSDFVTSFKAVKTYLSQLFVGKTKHYIGHNPAGGLMIIALLTSLIITTFTGMFLFATEGHGPFGGTFLSQLSEGPLEDIHEFFANFTVFMVVIHLSGVIVSSLLYKENLVKSMVTGKKLINVKTEENADENI